MTSFSWKRRSAALVLLLSLSTVAGLQAQTGQTGEQKQDQKKQQKHKKALNFGFRIRAFPLREYSAMESRSLMITTPATGATPARDWSFVTASHTAKFGYGAGFEYAPGAGRWTLTAEVLFNKLGYTKVTTVAGGTDDPATVNDERSRTFLTEDTRGRLWDIPVLFHYRGIRSSGPLSKLYVSGGATLRTVTNLRSSTTITNPDSSTSTNNALVPPSKRNLLGATAGVGIRIIDDFNINWTPEIRYTRWAGSTFGLESTISPRNQLELSLGFTF